MLGYANLSESQIVAGVQALARAASRSVPATSAAAATTPTAAAPTTTGGSASPRSAAAGATAADVGPDRAG